MAYWPCLLDRLIDHKPGEKVESEMDRRISKDAFIGIVVRDLSSLLNATSLPNRLYTIPNIAGHNRVAERMNFKFGIDATETGAMEEVDVPFVSDFPSMESSTLNYGFRDLNGTTIELVTINRLEKFILATIQRFEPRVRNLQVVARRPEDAKSQAERDALEKSLTQSVLSFEIRCKLEVDGMPHDLRIKSDVDLKTGHWTTS